MPSAWVSAAAGGISTRMPSIVSNSLRLIRSIATESFCKEPTDLTSLALFLRWSQDQPLTFAKLSQERQPRRAFLGKGGRFLPSGIGLTASQSHMAKLEATDICRTQIYQALHR